MEYREIAPGELDRALFRHFERRQEERKCRRRENGVWVVRDAPFIDDWSEADYAFLVQCLQNTLATGGVVLGAFADGALKGFASVESAPLGKAGDYRDLTCLREKEVFSLLVENKTTHDIAEILGISEKTVRNHISNTMQKLSVKGRAQAVVELIRLGEITL